MLPILVVHACYGLSLAGGHAAACVPYVDGCVSISGTGRHGWAYFLFKAGMLPTAVLASLFWLLAVRFLRLAGDEGAALRALLWLGVTSAAFLALYTTFLGHKGEVYHLLRRFGVSLTLGFGYLAHLLYTWRLGLLRARGVAAVPAGLLRLQQALLALLLVLGIGSIPVSNFIANKDPVENAIEWIFCLLLWSLHLLAALAWHRARYRLQAVASLPPGPA